MAARPSIVKASLTVANAKVASGSWLAWDPVWESKVVLKAGTGDTITAIRHVRGLTPYAAQESAKAWVYREAIRKNWV